MWAIPSPAMRDPVTKTARRRSDARQRVGSTCETSKGRYLGVSAAAVSAGRARRIDDRAPSKVSRLARAHARGQTRFELDEF